MNESVPCMAAMSRKQIELIAGWLVKGVSPKTLRAAQAFPIGHFCEFALERICGISFGVDYLPAGSEGKLDGNELIVDAAVYDRVQQNDGRARFTLAHELGHCMLHAAQLHKLNLNPGRVVLYRRVDLKPYNDPEWQANAFAGALLMPTAAMVHIVTEGGRCPEAMVVEKTTALLRVSRTAAEVRLRQLRALGLLPHDPSATCGVSAHDQ